MGDYSDSSNNLQFLFKKSLGVVSTFKDTAFYNEIARRFRTPVQAEDVNIETAPTLPDWEDLSLSSGAMASLGFDLDGNDFASVDFTELHTYDSTYTKNGTKTPGMYLDSSGIVALFVRLKLDKMEGDATTNLDDSAIVYTKYPTDSSNISLMDSAYQFNYNSQINVNSSIPIFKPYNYTLEYSSDDSTFYQVTNDIGNWSFDINSGTIIFEDDPSLNNNIIDLSNGDLYFTFVNYVGLQGIQNLIYHGASGHSGIGTKDPQSELDISGSMRITKDLTLTEDLYVSLTDVLHVDSTNKTVSIGLDTANYSASGDLHVVGHTQISGTLNISGGSSFGSGMCPIGTIIMWVTNTAPSGYGTWLLCDGRSCSQYTTLVTILGSDNVPDFSTGYMRSAANGDISTNTGGQTLTNGITLDISNLPKHTHELDGHSHNFSIGDHHHYYNITNSHSHSGSSNGHGHTSYSHFHNVTGTTNHTHIITGHDHAYTENGHTHTITHNHGALSISHHHEYDKGTGTSRNGQEKGENGSSLFGVNNISLSNPDGTTNQDGDFTTNTNANTNWTANNSTANDNAQVGTTTDTLDDQIDLGRNDASERYDTTDGADPSTNTHSGFSMNLNETSLTSLNQTAGIKLDDATVNLTDHNIPATVTTGTSFQIEIDDLYRIEIFYYIRAE